MFVDSLADETILEVAADELGRVLISFRLYDSHGRLTAESDGYQHFAEGLTVCCEAGEELLRIPADLSGPFKYRLYNSAGLLLTCSDGERTRIYPHLRMEGVSRGWTPNGS